MVECKKCGKTYEPSREPDPCFGLIPGVVHACCGHGRKYDQDKFWAHDSPYVVIGSIDPNTPLLDYEYGKDYFTLRGEDALKFFELFEKATSEDYDETKLWATWNEENQAGLTGIDCESE